MDIGEGGLSSSENGFGRFPLLNSQGSWLPATPMKPVPERPQTANGDEEQPWLSSLGLSATLYTPELSLHNADPVEASCSGSVTRYANPTGDLNLPQKVNRNDSAAAGGFGSNYRRGNVSSSFTEDLASVLTQITSNSLHSTIPATISQNNGGWHQREVHHPIPFTPTSMGNWTWQHSYLVSMSRLTQYASLSSNNNFVYGANSPSTKAASFSTSDAVAPLTPEKAEVSQKEPRIIQQENLKHVEQQQVQKDKWNSNGYPSQKIQNGFPIPYNKFMCGINPPSNDAAMFSTSNAVDAPVTPQKFAKSGIECSTSSIVYLGPTRKHQPDDGAQEEKHQPDEVALKTVYDVSWTEPSINQDNSLKHVGDSQQSETISLLKENVGLEKVHADGVDLNRTPSQKPKRRKIRPKVIREDKPKRPSKKDQVEQTPGEAPAERKKRPYRRKAKESPITGPADPVQPPEERKKRPYRRKAKETPIIGPAGCSPNATIIASCKRSLNFEFDAQARQDYAYLQADPHKPGPDNQHSASAENTTESVAFDVNHSIDNLTSIHVPLLEDSLPSPLKRKASTKWNPKDMARKKNSSEKGVHKKHQEDLLTTPSNNASQSMAGSNVVVRNTIYKDEAIVPSESQSCTQTSYFRNVQINPHGPTELAIGPKLTSMFQAHLYRNSGLSLADLFNEYKRLKQINDGTYKPDPCHEIFKNQNTETEPREVQSCKESTSTRQDVCGSDSAAVEGVYRCINTNQLTSQSFNEMLTSQSTREQQEKAVRQKCTNYKTPLEMEQQHSRMKHSYPDEKFSTFQHDQDRNCVLAQMEEKRNRSSSIHPNHIYVPSTLFPETDHSSITEHCVQESLNAHVFQGCQATLPTEGAQKEPKKRGRKRNSQTTKNVPSNAIDSQMSHAVSITNLINKPERRAILSRNLQRNLNTKFPSGVMNPIDEIIHSLQNLHIGSKNDECAVATVENAIVPYVADGTIIPYEPRRRRPRPKVDLDEETTRVWKLLMGNDSEWIDGTDADKEKWWAEERRVFQGRADSFIARMHLVQGDRRFSQWKGSVVDSVVGVFLTQNVSDHLSSSAFMALAARFPMKEKAESATASNNECIRSATGQVSSAGNLHETIQLTKSPAIMNVVSTSVQFQHSEHKESILPDKINIAESCGNTTTTKEENCIKTINSNERKVVQDAPNRTSNLQPVNEFDGKLMEPEDGNSVCFSVISSQDSTDSTAQAVDQTGSTADFSKPAEEPINKGKYSNFMQGSFSELLHIAGTPSLFKDFCANESLYLSLGQKISTTSDQLLHGRWGTNLNKGSQADSSLEIGNKGNSTDITNDFSAEGSSHITTFSLENHTPSFPNNATDLQFKSFQHGNQAVQQANLHSHRKVKDTADANALEHAGSVENQQFLKSKLDVISKDEVISNGKPRRKVFRAKKGEALSTKEKWDPLRREVMEKVGIKERCPDKKDSLDWEAVRHVNVDEVAETIKERGMNHMLAARIQEFLNRLVKDHGSTDLEWLRDVPPDKAKDFLLSINGLGLKSVECVRLLTLHHLAFPVDTNVGRICVRLGWVPLQPLPESLQLHLLELYPVLESIQKYLWPRLCKLDKRTLYELHYQLITFGKVFCTKSKPNCNACPMRGECRHFASAFASARLALPGPEEKSLVSSTVPVMAEKEPQENFIHPIPLPPPKELPPAIECPPNQKDCNISKCEPIIEEPKTPEPEHTENSESAIEDFNYDDPDEIPTIKLNLQELTLQVQKYIKDKNMGLQDPDMSKALVALTTEVASIPMPKLKNVSRLRTEHQVYELPDNHPLLNGLDKREPDDPCSYLLAIWTPGETAESVEPPKACCDYEASGYLCDRESCFSCNAIREANAQTVRGTLLIPCRTAMRGSFPLNGTYFQVNEVFADHESSLNPIAVSRALIWNLPRRTVYFGTSVTSIFKGLTTEGIQYCFWRGFVCMRGFDQKTRAPRPLMARLHFPASKQTRDKRKAANI